MANLYSIGYGNRSWEEVHGLLSARGCKFLIDVRSNPFSKFNPSFRKDSLVNLCRESGIRYVFMGDAIGGKPASSENFDTDGKVNYIRLSEKVEFQHGLSRLITANDKGICVCIMCSELRPQECHRCQLIGSELKKLGVDVIHIDEVGMDISQDEAIRRLTGGQDDIFGPSPTITRSKGTYKNSAKV